MEKKVDIECGNIDCLPMCGGVEKTYTLAVPLQFHSVSAMFCSVMLSSTALKLIMVGVTIVNLSLVSATESNFNLDSNNEENSLDQSLKRRASRNNYTYIPVGAYKVHTRAATWDMARRTCEKEGGYLAIINSDDESAIIGWLLEKSRPHIGSQNSKLAHVGVHELYGKDDWVTIYGDSMKNMGFDSWQPGEPDDKGDVEHCGSVFISGKLVDVRCESKLGFICELTHVPNSFPSDEERPVGAITHRRTRRSDYTNIIGIGDYKVHKQAATWNTARRTCEEEGAHLAIINSNLEDKAIAQLLNESRPHENSAASYYGYIGFRQLFKDSEFLTLNGETLEKAGFSTWCSIQSESKPANVAYCGTVDCLGHLLAFPCETLYGFVCELR